MARPRRPLSLRARLLLTVLGLLVVVFGVVGVITQAVLHDYLLHRLDGQLRVAAGRSVGGVGRGPGAGGPGAFTPKAPGQVVNPPACQVRGQAAGTVCATTTPGGAVVTASRLDPSGLTVAVAAAAQSQLAAVAADGDPHTVDLAGIGPYRVLATPGPGGGTVVTGLPESDVNDTVTRFAIIGGSVAGGGIVVAFVLGALVIGRTLRPLQRVASTAGRVAELTLDRGEVALAERVAPADTDARTEVGAVGAAMNAMLDNVDAALSARQASETRVRRFVADASHELRTPLAAIRGYAELTRRTHEKVPRDVAHALGRVESEAARMTTLVEDLLLLARLDNAQPLDAGDVDLSAVLVDCVSDAHAVSADHTWTLELPDGAVHVTGDAQRLHQVAANLLANAGTHTPKGTTVVAGLTRDSSGVVLTVTDDGPGIPDPLLPQLFERFVRGDSSRSRASGSTGLGLAIVEAVVQAHHGSVSAESRPGRTTFTVRLPAPRAEPGRSTRRR
ncbi:MAG: sensor histidine kinase [Mycobacteriales bacterium]